MKNQACEKINVVDEEGNIKGQGMIKKNIESEGT